MRVRLGLVAGAAIHELEILRAPPTPGAGKIRVAVHAGHVRVNGCQRRVFGDENGDFLAPAVARKVRFGVTPEALLVFQG